MKKLLLSLVALSLCFSVKAQDIFPVPETYRFTNTTVGSLHDYGLKVGRVSASDYKLTIHANGYFSEYNNVTPAAGMLLKGNGTYYDNFAKGTAGQFLKVNAAGTDLEWRKIRKADLDDLEAYQLVFGNVLGNGQAEQSDGALLIPETQVMNLGFFSGLYENGDTWGYRTATATTQGTFYPTFITLASPTYLTTLSTDYLLFQDVANDSEFKITVEDEAEWTWNFPEVKGTVGQVPYVASVAGIQDNIQFISPSGLDFNLNPYELVFGDPLGSGTQVQSENLYFNEVDYGTPFLFLKNTPSGGFLVSTQDDPLGTIIDGEALSSLSARGLTFNEDETNPLVSSYASTGWNIAYGIAGVTQTQTYGATDRIGWYTLGGQTTEILRTVGGSSYDMYLDNAIGTVGQVLAINTITGAGTIANLEFTSVLTTEVDGSVTNEGSLTVGAGTGSTSLISSNTSGSTDVTITAAGINTISEVGNVITLTATEVDGSITNELQTIDNTSDATSHTVTLSNSGGSLQFIEGTGITLTTGGTGLNGTVTLANTITQYTDELAQDAVGGIFNASLTYVDGTPLISIADRDYGSITTSSSGTTWIIDNLAVSNAMLANSTISGISLGSNLADLTATNSTITFSGTYNGSTARTIGLNLGNANTWTQDQSVPDEAYGATWDGSTEVPTKNAVYDKIQAHPFDFGTTTDVSHTGNTTETISTSISIPANTLVAGDIIEVVWRYRKTGTAGTLVPRVYFNTSAAIGGSTLAASSINSAALYGEFSRWFIVKSATTIESFNNAQTNVDDVVQSTSAVSTATVDLTVQNYLVFSVQLGNGADTGTLSFISGEVIRH